MEAFPNPSVTPLHYDGTENGWTIKTLKVRRQNAAASLESRHLLPPGGEEERWWLVVVARRCGCRWSTQYIGVCCSRYQREHRGPGNSRASIVPFGCWFRFPRIGKVEQELTRGLKRVTLFRRPSDDHFLHWVPCGASPCSAAP